VFGSGGYEGVIGQGDNVGTSGVSTLGDGVYGQTDGTTNKTFGVYGYDGASKAQATAGVFGSSSYGVGVEGLGFNGTAVGALASSGPGVLAESNSGDGVSGTSKGASGVVGYGGDPTNPTATYSADSTGVMAVAQSVRSTAFTIDAVYGTPMTVVAGTGSTKIMSLDASGNMTLSGTLTQNGTPSSVERDPQGVGRVVFSSQVTQATIEDLGEGQMISGHAYVALDPAFADLLDRRSPYLVFITPDGPTAEPLYVVEKSLRGFAVREVSNRATLTFDYRIVGGPQDNVESGARLPLYRDTVTSPAERAMLSRESANHRSSLFRFTAAPAPAGGRSRNFAPAPRVALGRLPEQLPPPLERKVP